MVGQEKTSEGLELQVDLSLNRREMGNNFNNWVTFIYRIFSVPASQKVNLIRFSFLLW